MRKEVKTGDEKAKYYHNSYGWTTNPDWFNLN